MAKFRYRMQNVLDIKRKLEDAAKMELAEAAAKVNEEEKKLKKTVRRKEDYEQEGKRLRSDVLNVVFLKENNRAIANLKEQIAMQEKRVEAARRMEDRARENLKNAMQERKTQEKLYDNAFESFIREENAKESKEIDELVSYTYGKRRREEIKEAGQSNG